MDVPFNILVLFVGIAFTIGIIGIILGLRKIHGSPFIVIVAGMLMFSYIAIIDKVEVDYVEDVEYSVSHPMNVTTSATSVAFGTTITGIAERPANVQSVLVGKTISCIEMNMLRTGNPTGTVQIGILDNDNRVVKLFGNITANTINVGTRSYQVCLPNHDYWTIAYNDYIGAKHTTSTGTDNIAVSLDATNPFDSTRSVRATYTSGLWSDTTGTDLRMKLTSDNANIIGKAVTYDLNDNDIYVFMIFFSAFFIFIGIMIMRQLK